MTLDEQRLEAAAATQHHLDEATRARHAGDLPGAIAALERAADLADRSERPSLRSAVRWRLAKARYDHGDATGLLPAVLPLLDQDPFAGGARTLRAVDPVLRRHWDHVGYGEPAAIELLAAARRAHAEAGDPFLSARADVHAAWQLACTGDLEALADLVHRWSRLSPRQFGPGPHRHPSAPDTPSSVHWVVIDLARTWLRAATWARAEGAAWRARELLEDAAEDAGLRRQTDPWFLDAIARAGLAFDDAEALVYLPAWRAALDAVQGPRGDHHRALARAWASDDPAAFAEAAELAERHHLGPEWAASAWCEALDRGHGPAAERAAALVSERGVRVFASRLP